MSQTVHISSFLVSANPTKLGQVENGLGKIPIIEVCHVDPAGKIIVTMETSDESAMVQALSEIQLIEGVVSAALVFHQVDESMVNEKERAS